MRWQTLIRRDIPFSELEDLQAELTGRAASSPEEGYLLLSEPRPTFSAGISASPDQLLWSESECQQRGVALHKVHRGGKWTYHGPGQIVVYPIFGLANVFPRTRVRGYLETFKASVHGFLSRGFHAQGLPAVRLEVDADGRPFGIYRRDDHAKLVSFGVGVRKGITSHGAALYHSGTQTFGGIVPCGVSVAKQATLVELGWQSDWSNTAQDLASTLVHDLETARAKEFSSTEKLVV